ncbi:hypothetical protein [Dyadobacter tibetensis]|uniref:hypothetical protein n=1 Tax=Dyadobacter tibetensis TaxID=1211851 RepID=UPI0004B8873D|nr:hypothetical protein [Dyadobacter tibetensis]
MKDESTNKENTELAEKLDYLNQITKDAKEYYQKLLHSNNEVPYILGQLNKEVNQLNSQVAQYERNVSDLNDK